MTRRRKEGQMRDFDLDLEGLAGSRHREQHEGESEHSPVMGKAIEARRPDAIGPKGMLHLQRAAGNAGVGALVSQRKEDEESPVKDVVRSSGQPLDRDTQSFMENKFGEDFSDVQVHTDGKAADSAKSVSAQAYTVGNHIVFNEGKYNPASSEGKHVLAHELTHVVQQRSGPVEGTSRPGGIKVSDPSDRFEREAEHNATQVMSSPSPASNVQTAGAGSSVQRQEEDDVQELPMQRSADHGREDEVSTLQAKSEEEEKKEEPASDTPAEMEEKKEDEVSKLDLQRQEEEAPEDQAEGD